MRRAPVRSQLSWMHRLKIGDRLQRGNSPPRVVRNISRYDNGDLRCVTFAIRHCSWTSRCYTVMHSNDLIQLGYTKVRGKYSLRTRLDKKIEYCITNHQNEYQVLDCCDVRGVA